MDFAIVDSRRELVDVGQVSDALDEVIDEPRRVLGPVRDVFLLLLIPRNFLLLPPIGTSHDRGILVGLIVRIAELRFVIEGKEELDVPCEDGSLRAT